MHRNTQESRNFQWCQGLFLSRKSLGPVQLGSGRSQSSSSGSKMMLLVRVCLYFCFSSPTFVVNVCVFLFISSFCLLLAGSQNNAKEIKTAPNQAGNTPGCRTLAMPLLGLGGGPGSETRSKFTLWDPYRMSALALVTRVKVTLDL